MLRKIPSAAWLFLILVLGLVLLPASGRVFAQSPPAAASQPSPGAEIPPEAGGPQGDLGPLAIPKKNEAPAPPPPRNPEALPGYSLSVNVPVVTVEAMVLSKEGRFIPGLKQEDFRVSEDGVPQQVTGFSQTQAPITAVMLVEFASNNYTSAFLVDALRAAYAFAEGLRKDDWVALVEYDLKPTILLDFTQDKAAVYRALDKLRVPGFSERNLFDALGDTLDRVDRIGGPKVIVVVGTGVDTFSRLTYDQLLKRIKQSQNMRIFTVSTGRAFNEWFDARYGTTATGQIRSLDYLQADNQMNTFAKLTGGRWYNPRFQAEFAEVFRDISGSVRNQYTLAYKPSNQKLDGTYRKLKVELLDPQTGKALTIRDQKNKEVKYSIIAREGYTARRPVE